MARYDAPPGAEEVETLWLKAAGRRIKVTKWTDNGRWYFSFAFNLALKDHLKQLEGTRFDWDNKWWHMPITQHNAWQLSYLKNENPYAQYDTKIIPFEGGRPELRIHQREMIQFILDRKRCVLAGEMGVGKTLTLIQVMELSGIKDWLWLGPKSALYSVMLEFRQWKAKVWPCEFMTYERFASMVKKEESLTGRDHEILQHPPMGLVCDESYKIKNPRSQRGRAIRYLADRMREVYGDKCFIVCMTGTPAPKSPLDWWNQCRVACPGFLIEGDKYKFDNRLAIYAEETKSDGGQYRKLLGWKRGEGECDICAQKQEAHVIADHIYVPANDEVTGLYKRMRGLVGVWLKKDCLDLPEKQYRRIYLEPDSDTLSAADIVAKTTTRAAHALILLRELSDGFQYREMDTGKRKTCSSCNGNCQVSDCDDVTGSVTIVDCPTCSGTGSVSVYERRTIEVPCPKYEQLKLDLDAYEEAGRVVIYGGFHGTIDRCVNVCSTEGWSIIKVTSDGFWCSENCNSPTEMLEMFADLNGIDKVAFIGHPGAAGAGLNLTASPVEIFVSNDFNAGSRRQAEDRIHRMGMRGAMIIDYIHLNTDRIVLDNLLEKKELEAITLGDIKTALESREARSM